MKNVAIAFIVLLNVQSYAADFNNNETSTCVVKDFVSNTNSGIKQLETVSSSLGPLYNTQELVFGDFHVVYYIGTRNLNLLKNGKYLIAAKVSSLRSGEMIKISAFDSQTGQPTASLSCKLVWKAPLLAEN